MRRLRTLLFSLAATALLVPGTALASHELFISEYVEGTSFNKGIEIYNPTGASVDLSTYSIQIYFNGSVSPGSTIPLSAVSLAAGDVWVVANTSASFAGSADQTSGSLNFNGDDAVVLLNGASTVDAIGQIGFDPGTEWGLGDASTADNTIRRNSDVCDGDIDSGNPFDPSIQWAGFPVDTFDGLGAHSATCSSVPAAGAWGLAAMGVLMLAGAAIALRRRFA